MTRPDLHRRRVRLLAAVMVPAGALIGGYELGLTRLASVLFFHDLAYLCVAVALLALGGGALYSRRLGPGRILGLVAVMVLSIPASWWALCGANAAWGLGVFAVPFAFFGAASGLAYRAAATASGRALLYACEVSGTLLGLALLGPAVLPVLPMPVLEGPGLQTHLRARVRAEGLREHRQVTTAYARTDLVWTERRDVAYVFTDAMFPARAVAWDGRSRRFASARIERLAGLKRLPYAIAPHGEIGSVVDGPPQTRFGRRPGESRPSVAGGDVLLVGAGAGFDIAVALQQGVGRVVAVEVNPQTVAFARRLDAFAGGLLARPEVERVVAEGRRFIGRRGGRYDHINLTLVQTAPAGDRARHHVDGRILTVEALRSWLGHLRAGGILAVTQNTRAVAERTMAGLRQALTERGLDPDAHLLALRLDEAHRAGNPFSHLLVARRTPFATAERARVAELAATVGAVSWTPAPASLPAPATDERPCLFEQEGPWPLQVPLGVLAALLVLGTAWLAARRDREVGRVRAGAAAALAGLATMMVQVIAAYRAASALGSPALALQVALAAVLGGSAVGAWRWGGGLGARAGWRRAGWAATLGVATLVVLGPRLAAAAAGWSIPVATGAIAALLALCSLPLGLPMLAAMQRARGGGEGLVVGCDGAGGVLGASLATAVTWTVGYTALGLLATAAMGGFVLLAPGPGSSPGRRRTAVVEAAGTRQTSR